MVWKRLYETIDSPYILFIFLYCSIILIYFSLYFILQTLWCKYLHSSHLFTINVINHKLYYCHLSDNINYEQLKSNWHFYLFNLLKNRQALKWQLSDYNCIIIQKKKEEEKNRWKQWPASLPSATTGGARKPPGQIQDG